MFKKKPKTYPQTVLNSRQDRKHGVIVLGVVVDGKVVDKFAVDNPRLASLFLSNPTFIDLEENN